MAKSKGGPVNSKSEFIRISGQRYDAMVVRLAKKSLPLLTFGKAEYRDHILAQMCNSYDGVLKCRYCNFYFTFQQVAIDHAIPLSRSGSTDVENLEFPCKGCNDIKGSMTPTEFLEFLRFLETKLPYARQDILNRLRISVQLAAGARGNAGVIGDLKKTGHWKAAQIARRKNKT